jgi:hypothetical protein
LSAVSSDAAGALTAFERRSLIGFSGLPPETSVSQAAAALGADPETFGRWFLGDHSDEAFYCPTEVEGYKGPVKIWFRGDRVLKVQGDWPTLATGIVKELGEPDDRVDYQLGSHVVAGGERVYANRGLAVRLNRTEDLVTGVAIFPATTPGDYRERLREPLEYREAPSRE